MQSIAVISPAKTHSGDAAMRAPHPDQSFALICREWTEQTQSSASISEKHRYTAGKANGSTKSRSAVDECERGDHPDDDVNEVQSGAALAENPLIREFSGAVTAVAESGSAATSPTTASPDRNFLGVEMLLAVESAKGDIPYAVADNGTLQEMIPKARDRHLPDAAGVLENETGPARGSEKAGHPFWVPEDGTQEDLFLGSRQPMTEALREAGSRVVMAGEMGPDQGKSGSDDAHHDRQHKASPDVAARAVFQSENILTPGMRQAGGSMLIPTVEIDTSRADADVWLVRQMIDRIDFAPNTREGEWTLRLKPDVFGELNIRMEMIDNHLTARFVTDSHPTRVMLQTQIHMLEASLREHGIDVQNIEVSFAQTGVSEFSHGRRHAADRPVPQNQTPTLSASAIPAASVQSSHQTNHRGVIDLLT
ncbi:MAG: flagellar hook-length control protein FliK [Clostridiaceae bacterium]|nr:flagellar hook-length control protein FliK [Clostridiaceae bacterium]